jgi:hypothetical protein
LADVIAVHIERQTATMLRTHRLSFLDRGGTLRQIPLEKLASHGPRGEIRVLDNVQAVPASIRIERQSLLERDLRPCPTAVTAGRTVFFGANLGGKDSDCIGAHFLRSGWGAMESGHVWSLGKDARLSIAIADMPRGNLDLTFDLSTYTGIGFYQATQTVRVLVKGRLLATWAFTTGAPLPDTRIGLGPDLLEPNGVLDVEFEIDPPMNPKKLGLANDDRELGISLRSLRIDLTGK